MAIQMRRGQYAQFDPTRLVPGEIAVVLSGDGSTTDGRAVYVCVAAGSAKRLTTAEEFATAISNALADLEEAFTDDVQAATQAALDAAEEARGAMPEDMRYYITFETVGGRELPTFVDVSE